MTTETIADVTGTVDTEDSEVSGDVNLGSDIDCETCGFSYNRVSWYYDHQTGQVEVQAQVGCYGGENLTTADLDEAAAFITGYQQEFPQVAAALVAEAEHLRAAVTAALS